MAANDSHATAENIDTADEKNASRRNGRYPHTIYKNAVEHHVSIEGLAPGDPCPLDCGGKLYSFRPSTIIRIKGNPMGCAHRYIIEKLRCSLCGEIVSAKASSDMREDKYDACFVAQLSIQKYYMGMPSYRLEGHVHYWHTHYIRELSNYAVF